jgi:hypothetical protein
MCQDEGRDGQGLAEGCERVQVSFHYPLVCGKADG